MYIISEKEDSVFNATRNNASLFTNGSARKLLEGDKTRDVLNIWRGDRSQGICFCREVEGTYNPVGMIPVILICFTAIFFS